MNLSFAEDRILAVVAHPDDAELLCAGTLARAKEDGADISICVCCNGDKGHSSRPVENLAEVRQQEMAAAADVLGANLYLLNIPDGELADNTANRRSLIEIVRRCKTTHLLAHASTDYHPDHQAASKLAEAASWFSASRGHKTESPALHSPPALWWMDTVNMLGFEPGLFIDVSDYASVKEDMLACHRSQLARSNDGDFSSLLELMRLQYRTRGMQSGVEAAEAFRIHPAFKRVRAA